MPKTISCIVFLAIFVPSSFAFNTQELPVSRKCLIANSPYDPLTIIANITLGKRPHCIAVDNETNRIYVGVDGGLIVIDGWTDQVLAEIPLGSEPWVQALAVNPLTNRIYAAGMYVSVIDGTTNLKVGEIREISLNPYELAVDPVTNCVYVAYPQLMRGEADGLRVYSGEDFQYIAFVALGTTAYQELVAVAVNPNTNKVYATWSGNDSLYMMDGYTNTIMKNADAGPFSFTLKVNPYTNYVYVGGRVLDGNTLGQVTSGYTGGLEAIDPVNNLLYTIFNHRNLCRLNGWTHNVIDSISLPWEYDIHWAFNGQGIAVNPTTFKVYIINDDVNETCVVSAGTPTPDTTSPTTSASYEGLWHTSDFTIALTATDAKSGVAETYYKVNDGPTENVSINGQPYITAESENNTLEYWSVDNSANEELPHKTLFGIKLDKTKPTIGVPSRIPENDVLPYQEVKVTVDIIDALSKVKNATLLLTVDDGTTWTNSPMNYNLSTSHYETTIQGQKANTTVKYKIIACDFAGNNATTDGTAMGFMFEVVPEFPTPTILSLFMILTMIVVAVARKRFSANSRPDFTISIRAR